MEGKTVAEIMEGMEGKTFAEIMEVIASHPPPKKAAQPPALCSREAGSS